MNPQKIKYGFFVVGVTIGLFCLSLLLVKYLLSLPIMPAMVYYLLAVPPLGFYLWSEYARRTERAYEDSRDAAMVLLLLFLGFYFVPQLIRFLLLPEYIPSFFHYSQHALLALLIGLLLIRLHALGGGKFLVFTGMLVDVAALFFLAIRIPDVVFGVIPQLSAGKTFEFFSFVMIALSYLLLIAMHGNRGITPLIRAFGNIDEQLWFSLRSMLLLVLLSVSHLWYLLMIVNFEADLRLVGVLLLLLAGLWIYTGYYFRTMLPYSLAYLEIAAAIFSCKSAASYWPESWVIWLSLGVFIALIPLYSLFLKGRYTNAIGHLYLWLCATAVLILYEHFTFYGLQSRFGIMPLILLWLVVFAVPVAVSAREWPFLRMFLGGLVYTPALLFFLQQGPPSIDYLPQILLTAVIISCVIVAYRLYNWQWFAEEEAQELRVVHYLHWFLVQPYSLITVFVVSTLAVFVVHILSYVFGPGIFGEPFFSMLMVQGILMVYWFDLARKRQLWWATIAAETMVAGVILTLRQGLPFLLDVIWTDHWDMLIGWGVGVSIAVARPLLQHEHKAIRLPLRMTLFGLPVITAMYALHYAIDFEFFSLIVLPLYSLLFLLQALSERDRFVLAYAFCAINSYLLLLFLHQQFHSVQLYVTPVCLSVMILVEVFRDMTTRATANFVRGGALFILLGVAMFQAIIKNYLSFAPHGILLAFSTLAVIAANLLRVRIFAAAGFFCFIIDLIAIVYISLSQQDIETLMVILGVGLTLIGLVMLAGYYVYRQRKVRIDSFISMLKARFYSWE